MATHHPQHGGWPDHDRDANAPEVAQLTSPSTAVPSFEREWQSQYQQTRAAENPPLPSGDTAKEAYNLDGDAKYVVPMEVKAEYPETVTGTPTATATSPQMSVPWTPDSVRMQPIPSGAVSPDKPHHDGNSLAQTPQPGPDPEKEETKDKQKILGMSRKAFLILIVVLIIVIAAAVGGGVGGAVASSNKSKADAATPTSSSSPSSTTAPSSTTSSATTTSSSEPLPTLLTNETWPKGPKYAFQGFSRSNYTGQPTKIVTSEGGTDFSFDLHSYIWIPNINNCCVNFCANSTKEGYIGYRCTEYNQTESSDPIARAFVWCQDKRSDEISKEKGCS
ncbi:hypothetical protein O9K51_00058 [Purpureocillium lavendulum]|uniref:Uncharacterized protein n=1 Tax=Purpureocillium lavendulum TaxID=1247861 RepID=A0AB34G1B2_9HYPO|nr:hypothetical protein O9K51_00058 [Purpureocillium lavendulum]